MRSGVAVESDKRYLPNKMTLKNTVFIALRVFLLTHLGTKAQVRKQTPPAVTRFWSHLRTSLLVAHRGEGGLRVVT